MTHPREREQRAILDAREQERNAFLRRGMLPPGELERQAMAVADTAAHEEDCICEAQRIERQTMQEERDADFDVIDDVDPLI